MPSTPPENSSIKLIKATLIIGGASLLLQSCGLDTNVTKLPENITNTVQASCYHPGSSSFEENKKISLICTDSLGPCHISVCKDDRYEEFALSETYVRYINTYGGKLYDDPRLCKTPKVKTFRCDHPLARNYKSSDKCIFEVCPDPSYYEYQFKLDFESYLQKHGAERGEIVHNVGQCKSKIQIECCSHPEATNYFNKTTLSGQCQFHACLNKDRINYNASKISEYEEYIKNYGGAITNKEDLCGATVVQGCMNLKATNFNANANVENGTCNFKGCLDKASSGPLDTELEKIIDTYKQALSSKGIAYIGTIDSTFGCSYGGCMELLATNFDSKASTENGSCQWQGCIDSTYKEYNDDLKKAYEKYKTLYPNSPIVSTCNSKNSYKVTRSVEFSTEKINMKLSLVIDTSASMSNIITKVKDALAAPLKNLKTQHGTITVDLHDLSKLASDNGRFDYFDELNQFIPPPECVAGSNFKHCGGSIVWEPINGKTRFPNAPIPVYSFAITAQSTESQISSNVITGINKIVINSTFNNEQGLCYLYRLVRDNFLKNQKNAFIIISDENDNSNTCIHRQAKFTSNNAGYYSVSYRKTEYVTYISYTYKVNGESYSNIIQRSQGHASNLQCDGADYDFIRTYHNVPNLEISSCIKYNTSTIKVTQLLSSNQFSKDLYNNFPENLCSSSFTLNGVEVFTDLKDYVVKYINSNYAKEELTCTKVMATSNVVWGGYTFHPSVETGIINELNRNITWARQNYAFGSIIFDANNNSCTSTELLNKVHGAKYITLHNNLVATQNKINSKIGDICTQNYEALLNDIIFETFKKIITYAYLVADKGNITVTSVYLIKSNGDRILVGQDKYKVVVDNNKTYIEFDESYSDQITQAKDVEINYFEN